MKADPEEARKLIQDAIDVAARRRGDDGVRFADFGRAFLRGTEGRPLQTHGADGLVGVAWSVFDLAQRRGPGERRLRVRLPPELPGRSVIEILQQDRPFLVDTVRLFLRRHQLQEQMLLHPTLMLRRDASGVLLGIDGADAVRESLIYVEVYPCVDEARARELEADLDRVMAWVANVTDDHRRMIRVVREIGANLEFLAGHIEGGAERVAKIGRFFDWLVEDHFVFMGTRRYAVREVGGEPEIRLLPDSGLGMWRGDDESRFREPQRGEAIPIALRAALDDPRIVQVAKGWTESHIHRAGRLDRIIVKELDDRGAASGFYIISGLFTYRALRTPCSQVPLLAERLQQILSDDGAAAGSHRYKAHVTAFDAAPMEFLLGTEIDDNAALIREIVDAEGAEEPRVVLRTDAGERSFYAAVILPRERYSEELRGAVRTLLDRDPAVGYIDDRVSLLEEDTALLHFFCTVRSGPPPRAEALEAEVLRLATRWEDGLTDELIERYGAAEGGGLAARYAEAFPPVLRVTTDPENAVRDVEALETLHRTGEPQIRLFEYRSDAAVDASMLRIYLQTERLLSDLLPLVDHFGIRVIDARQAPLVTQDRELAFIHALRVMPLGESQEELDAIAGRLEQALRVVLMGTVPDDALNALVLVAGLDWREVDLIRAYLEYLNQIQSTLTRAFVRGVLIQNPVAVRILIELHGARLGPGPEDDERSRREASLRERFERYRDRIPSLNEDRALGSVLELIDATLRTSFFARIEGAHRISIKLDPSLVPSLPSPHAYREIFVHGSGVEGIHIRGGAVARGGIRWSDRLDDFRTEVLGLMRTQQLKNGLIVPVGAKGGFVLPTMELSPQEARSKADEAYRVFIAGLLDVTDNVDTSGSVVTPKGVFRRDGDDPYLVVAADKGTAHLSDAANEIALERDFWLGDAFASGGSVGYDHKRYGITARGAWECVKHHFFELGIDPERDEFTVAGIGDMSGDVFGNGLLLMRRALLVAAFDHRHIFLDPDPDPEQAWEERKRLFALSRSTWEDYSPERISPGGGVWPRSAKRIALSEQARVRLGIDRKEVTGQELVRAVLSARVDLLWNGGIGTYVKSTAESHPAVGDRSNDAVRIDATELGARVIGEGGNLGLTQAARVEAARCGVRLDSDAIHNSAGVDLSDHEVNLKILLAPLVRAGTLAEQARVEQLFEVVEDACESVLSHNRSQVLCISLDERRARRDFELFRSAIETLCEAQGVTPAEVGLPDEATLQSRRQAEEGLFRPELAVLLGLAKLHGRLALVDDALVERSELEVLHVAQFPATLQARHPDAIRQHRLRREMTALAATNRIVDAGGVTAITELVAHRGLSVAAAVGALLAADDVLDGSRLRAELLALRGTVEIDAVYEGLIVLDEAVHDVARYLLAEGGDMPPADRTTGWRVALFELADRVDEFLSSEEIRRFAERSKSLERRGLPASLAAFLAGAPLADRGLNIVRVTERVGRPVLAVGRAYACLGEASGLNWMFHNLPRATAGDRWDRMVLTDLRTELLFLQRSLLEFVLRDGPEDPVSAVEAFLATRPDVVERVRAMQPDAEGAPSASALTVVAQALQRLRPQD